MSLENHGVNDVFYKKCFLKKSHTNCEKCLGKNTEESTLDKGACVREPGRHLGRIGGEGELDWCAVGIAVGNTSGHMLSSGIVFPL